TLSKHPYKNKSPRKISALPSLLGDSFWHRQVVPYNSSSFSNVIIAFCSISAFLPLQLELTHKGSYINGRQEPLRELADRLRLENGAWAPFAHAPFFRWIHTLL
ncbi:MAG TPA: hypothetical protein VNM45_20070, partial [Bacillus sp. (in: firmicutes)]|nr:hypothetical protein [Bacillus sp. (in: firmicutes)]